MSEEEQIIYDEIVKIITKNKLMSISGTPMTLNEVNDYIINLQQENRQLNSILTELEEWLKEKWYEIEPKGTGINFNCEYDNEEDYVSAMETKSKLDTLKNTLYEIQKLKEKYK